MVNVYLKKIVLMVLVFSLLSVSVLTSCTIEEITQSESEGEICIKTTAGDVVCGTAEELKAMVIKETEGGISENKGIPLDSSLRPDALTGKNTGENKSSDTREAIDSITKGKSSVKEDPKKGEIVTVRPTTLEGIPMFRVTEGKTISLKNIRFIDDDGDKLEITWPAPISEGVWATRVGDAGQHRFTVTASDGKTKAEKQFIILVEAVNKPPSIAIASSFTVNEGEKISLNPAVTDPDDDKVTVTYSGFMSSHQYLTTYEDAGQHTVKISASDGKTITTKQVTIEVKDVNRAPAITSLKVSEEIEGGKVKVEVVASDPDNDQLTTTYSDPFDTGGEWQTGEGDAGNYKAKVTVSDGGKSDERVFSFTIEAKNKAPVMQRIPDVFININKKETKEIRLKPIVSDPDGDQISITYEGWMTSPVKRVTYSDGGSFTVTVSASDGKDTTAQTVKVTINRAPQIVVE